MRDDAIIVVNELYCTVMVLKGDGAERQPREYVITDGGRFGVPGPEPIACGGEVFERTLSGGFMRPDVQAT